MKKGKRKWQNQIPNLNSDSMPHEREESWHKWYLKNKETVKARARKHYQDNKEHKKALARKWYEEHKEQALKTRAEYYQNNRSKVDAKKKEWKKKEH